MLIENCSFTTNTNKVINLNKVDESTVKITTSSSEGDSISITVDKDDMLNIAKIIKRFYYEGFQH